MDNGYSFYKKMLGEFIPDKASAILVCGAGQVDSVVFHDLGYVNVTMSGLDTRVGITNEYDQIPANAEALDFSDDSFDYCVMHASIHHTRLPHKVLTELYRVSRIGCMVIEARDSALIRLTKWLGFTEEYEVKGNFPGSGVNGSDIPNYIFRWTEQEVVKTIKCYDPKFKHSFFFRYGTYYPFSEFGNGWRKWIVQILYPFYAILALMFPTQQNRFCFYVSKGNDMNLLHPWLICDELDGTVKVDRNYIRSMR